MFRPLLGLLLVVSVVTTVWAQEARPVEGTLTLGGKPHKLLHAAAYESKFNDEPTIVVIASDRPIDIAAIKAVLKENDGSDEDVSPRQPHIKVTFKKSGPLRFFVATSGGFTTNAGDATGEVKLEEGRVTGTAKLESTGEKSLQRSFDFRFAVNLLGSSGAQPSPAAPLAKLGVEGTFKGNGKPARLAFVSARPGEPFADKPSLKLIFTEKDHSKEKRPDFRAAFGDFGSAIIISCHEDGGIFGCEVAHAAHARKPFSSVGSIEIGEFQIAGGQVQGKLTTNGQVDTFDQTWEVDLQFAAPYMAPKATAATPAVEKPTTGTKPKEPAPDKPAPMPGEKLKVKDLAILQGVEDVEYKAAVEHVSFKSTANYRTLAAEIVKKLEAQGWQKDGAELIGVSAILNRKRGEATLKIFVKPAGAGSTVTIFTEGLDWDE